MIIIFLGGKLWYQCWKSTEEQKNERQGDQLGGDYKSLKAGLFKLCEINLASYDKHWKKES